MLLSSNASFHVLEESGRERIKHPLAFIYSLPLQPTAQMYSYNSSSLHTVNYNHCLTVPLLCITLKCVLKKQFQIWVWVLGLVFFFHSPTLNQKRLHYERGNITEDSFLKKILIFSSTPLILKAFWEKVCVVH